MREIGITVTVQYHFTLNRIIVIKGKKDNKHWRGYEKKKTLHTIGEILNQYSHCRQEHEDASKNQKWKYSAMGILTKELKSV